MDEAMNSMAATVTRSLEQGSQMLDKILAAARPGAVFGEPVKEGVYTIITACEVTSGGGFGSGMGSGPAQAGAGKADISTGGAISSGGGMGGGGGAMSRPVATIIVGPDGVRVEPIVDVTKLGLAGITAWVAMGTLLIRFFKK
ncbi:MAG: hypothetical protein HY326_13380 [Chloroflexi bacterium]|nr:hypothetical protein [Chloroflexota bacterium]